MIKLDVEFVYYRNYRFDGKFHVRCIGADLHRIKSIRYVLRSFDEKGPSRLDSVTAISQTESGDLADHGCPAILGTRLDHGHFEISASITLTDHEIIKLNLPDDADARVYPAPLVMPVQPQEARRSILDRVPLDYQPARRKRSAGQLGIEGTASDPAAPTWTGLPLGADGRAAAPLLIKFGMDGFACLLEELQPASGSVLARRWPNLLDVIELVPLLDPAEQQEHPLAALRGYYVLAQPASMLNDTFVELMRTLAALDYVEALSFLPCNQDSANLVLLGAAAVVATLITGAAVVAGNKAQDEAQPTPDFEALQTYLDAPTATSKGMNVRQAWAKQVTGKGARVHFSDGGLVQSHEDLRGGDGLVVIKPVQNDDPEHGTASVGLLYARANGFGMTGICHDSELYVYDSRARTGDGSQRTPKDLLRYVRAGDIVAINRQTANVEVLSTFLPSLHDRNWWEVCKALNERGAVVINAACNGSTASLADKGTARGHGVDLGQWRYFEDYGDAGTLLVGACQSWDGKPHQYSNHSYRYRMLNAWGDGVATLGYGKLQDKQGSDRDYTHLYGGTSSATPLVTGALSLIQSYAINHHHIYLDANQMHLLVMASGYADATAPLTGVLPMGRRPNVHGALQLLDRILGGGSFITHDEL